MSLSGASRAGFALAARLLCAACDKEERASDANDVVEAQDGTTGAVWLRATDHVDPALWPANREAGRERAAKDVAVEHMREALLAAPSHFLESDRRLANRTAQIERRLAEDGRAEDYAGLLEALANVAAAAGRKQTYGELCQHYYNLRHKDATREETLRLLSDRCRTQKQFRQAKAPTRVSWRLCFQQRCAGDRPLTARQACA